jgi:hypothetical protein
LLSAKTASKSIFLAIRWMIDFQRALIFIFALFKVFLSLISDLPGFAMARITEVMRAETEKESDATAESALVINEGFFVLFAKSISIVGSFQNV